MSIVSPMPRCVLGCILAAAFSTLFALNAGCASRGRASFQPVQLEPDQGVIYVFRPREGRGDHVETFIDAESVGSLDRGEFRAHVLEPGEYLVRAESRSSVVRSAVVIPQDATFLMVRVGRRGRVTLEAPEPDLARRLIAGLRQAEAPEPAQSAAR